MSNKPKTPAEPLSHTPGPWTHIPRTRDGHADVIASKGRGFIMVGVPVAETPILDHPHDNIQTANARLVAAAPELLAALTRLSFAASCRDNTSGDHIRVMEVRAELLEANRQAQAAIAAALTV